MNSYFRTLFFLPVILLFVSCEVNNPIPSSAPHFRTGDSINWAEKNYDEQGWRTFRGDTKDSIFWARLKVSVDESPAPTEHLGVNINAFGSYEAYWDGILIGTNGTLAESGRAEIPGTENSYFLIPDSLIYKGKHTIALRASQSYLSNDQRAWRATVGDYSEMLTTPLKVTALMYILAGVFLMAALYYIFLFVNDRKAYPTLIFGVTSFLFFLLLILEYVKFYVDIPYHHFYTRLEIIGGLTFAIAFLVPFYFTLQFSFPYKKLFLGLLLMILLSIYALFYQQYDETAYFLAVCMWLASVFIVGYAAVQKIMGAKVVLIGLVLTALLNYFFHYDISVFLSFSIILGCMLYLLALKTKETEQAYESSLLLSARLENELLKKNIQPHFLMNTLTSLMDWVEEAPKEGVKFIGALSREFDILNRVSAQNLIPIGQEIDLCQSHLQVMQYRKEIKYDWEDFGIDPKETVPPALLLTLLENGITHSIPPANGVIAFKLYFEKGAEGKKYELLTIAKNRSTNDKDGTGFRYIKSRLKESYGNSWDVKSREIPEGWKTTISLYNQ